MLRRMLAPATFFNFQPAITKSGLPYLIRPQAFQRNARAKPVKNPHREAVANPKSNPPETYNASKVDITIGISVKQFIENLLISNSSGDNAAFEQQAAKLSFNLDFKLNFESFKAIDDAQNSSGNLWLKISDQSLKQDAVYTAKSNFSDRNSQVNLFYRQTENVASRITTLQADTFRGVRNKIAAEFNYDFSIDLKFLRQFAEQSAQLQQLGGNEFDGYIQTTGELIERSVGITSSFFDTVEAMLDSSRSNFLKRVQDFFNELRSVIGLDQDIIDMKEIEIISAGTAFFDQTLSLLNKSEVRIIESIAVEIESTSNEAPVSPEAGSPPPELN